MNVGKGIPPSLEGAWAIDFEEWVKKLEKSKGWAAFIKCLNSLVKESADSRTVGSISNATVSKSFNDILMEVFSQTDHNPFSKPLAIGKKEEELLGSIFSVHAYSTGANWFYTGPTPFCLSEYRLILTGEELIMGFKITDSTKAPDMMRTLESLDGPKLLEQHHKDPANFMAVLGPKKLFYVPDGYLVFNSGVLAQSACAPCGGRPAPP
eukprot:5631804-Pyramimonas_sp.AAC.1